MSDILQWGALPGFLVAACLLAWWLGATAEKYAALFILAANVAADVILWLAYPHFPSAAMCAVDFGLACGLLAIAVRYSNYWLGFALLLQSIALCLQALDLAGDGPSVFVHAVVNNALSYSMVACLIGGTLGTWRAKRQGASGQAVLTPHLSTKL